MRATHRSTRSFLPGLLLEPLESRTLLSAAPVCHPPVHGGNGSHAAASPTVTADLLKLKTDGAAFLAHLKSFLATLRADLKALHNGATDANVQAAQAKLDADHKALDPQLAADQAAIDDLDARYGALLEDDQTALATAPDLASHSDALTKLLADQQAYVNELSVAQNKLTRDSAVIADDEHALQIAMDAAGGGASDNTAAKAKLAADRLAFDAVRKTDRAAIEADLKQLAADRKAARAAGNKSPFSCRHA
jgi:chromosome segregation ATPase